MSIERRSIITIHIFWKERIGKSNGLFHRPPVPTLSPTPCHRPCPQRARAQRWPPRQRGPPGGWPCGLRVGDGSPAEEGERGLLPTLKRGTDTNTTLKEGASSDGHAAPAR